MRGTDSHIRARHDREVAVLNDGLQLRLEIGELAVVLTVNDPGRLSITIGSDHSRPSESDVADILGKLRRCHSIREVEVDAAPELGVAEDMSHARSYFATMGDRPVSKWRGKKERRR